MHANGRETQEVPTSPFDQILLNESHPTREEVVPATAGTISMPVTAESSYRRSKRLLRKEFEKKSQAFTSGASTSSGIPQRRPKATSMALRSSTILTDGNDERHSENVTATTSSGMDSPITDRPPGYKRLASKKSRSNSKAGTRKGKRHLAAARKAPESRKSKLSGHTTLYSIRTVENHSPAPAPSANKVPRIPPSEDATIHTSLVEEDDITQDSDEVHQVSQNERQRKPTSTDSDSGGDTDTSAPARKRAKLSSSTQDHEYPLQKQQLTKRSRAQGKLENAVRCLQKRHTTRRWQYAPSVVVAKVNLGQDSTYETKRKGESRSQICYPSDGAVALEHSQPETINLIDEEVECTQNGTQENYGPLEKMAYETFLSDQETETVVSDSTASLSPIFLKKPSLPNLYGFRKRC